jgi:hypothetical protein
MNPITPNCERSRVVERLTEYNHNHDARGEFASGSGGGPNQYGIHNANSSTQGFHAGAGTHALAGTIKSHGYTYSHSTPVHMMNGSVQVLHTYKRGEHNVSTTEGNHTRWQTSTSSASGVHHTGSGAAGLDKHLTYKDRRYFRSAASK